MAQDFEIIVSSDEDYEDLIAEILYQGEFVCLITQESGFEALDIEIHNRVCGQPWRFKLLAFMDTIAQAKKRLWELRKITPNMEVS
jgi:hypothetical protein